MIQKIIKVGNSAAITIPKQFLKEAKMKVGDEVIVEENARNEMLLIKSKKRADYPSLTPEFFSWLDMVTKKYKEVIAELANR